MSYRNILEKDVEKLKGMVQDAIEDANVGNKVFFHYLPNPDGDSEMDYDCPYIIYDLSDSDYKDPFVIIEPYESLRDFLYEEVSPDIFEMLEACFVIDDFWKLHKYWKRNYAEEGWLEEKGLEVMTRIDKAVKSWRG